MKASDSPRAIPLVVCIASITSACGDAAAPSDYPGEPLFRAEALAIGTPPASEPVAAAVGLVWVSDRSKEHAEVTAVVAPVSAAQIPFRFDFALFDLPPREHLERAVSDDGTVFLVRAAAEIAVIDDVNRDGAFAVRWGADVAYDQKVLPPDRLLGIALRHIIVYVETPPARSASFRGDELDPLVVTRGYHVLRTCLPDESPACNYSVDDGTPVAIVFGPPWQEP